MDILINIISRKDSTVQEVRALLENQPYLMNQEYGDESPLSIAIWYGIDLELIKEFLLYDTDVNQMNNREYSLLNGACESILQGITRHLEILKLLLELGADVNINGQNYKSPLCTFKLLKTTIEEQLVDSMVQLLLKHADISTKNKSLFFLFLETIIQVSDYSDVAPEIAIKKYFRIMHLFLETGVHPKLYMFSWLFKFILGKGPADCVSRNTFPFSFVIQFYEIIVPYMFVRNNCEDEDLMKYDMNKELYYFIEKIELLNRNNGKIAKTLLCSLARFWRKCLKEHKKMSSDVLSSKRSVLHALQDLLGPEPTNLSVSECYEMLIRVNSAEYCFCASLLKKAVFNCDLVGLYAFSLNQQSITSPVLSPHTFYYVIKFLTKSDVLNFLLAFVSKKK